MSFRKLVVWEKAMDLVTLTYAETEKLPDSEKYGLYSQMRRSALSIPCNIAEGHGRSGTKEFIRFIDIAFGSLRELQTQIEIAKRLSFLEPKELETMADEVGRLLFAVRKGLLDK
jgi:four helix bundle protein